MSAEKKTPATVLEHHDGQDGAAALVGATTPMYDFITVSNGSQILVSDFLRVGVENAVPLRQLKATTGLKGRTIRKMIEGERRRGTPILSGQRGYFLAENTAEAKRFIGSMCHRARQIMSNARAVAKAVGLPQHEQNQLDGQEFIWGGDSD